jgi:hypothetical protein
MFWCIGNRGVATKENNVAALSIQIKTVGHFGRTAPAILGANSSSAGDEVSKSARNLDNPVRTNCPPLSLSIVQRFSFRI